MFTLYSTSISKNPLKMVNLYEDATKLQVNSVQDACAKCFAVHILKFEVLQTAWKTKQKTSKCYIYW